MTRFAFVMPYHICQNCGGGAEVQAWLLAKELACRGHDVHYICQSIVAAKVGQAEMIECVRVHWLPLSRRFLWLDASKYYRTLADVMPDVVIQRLSSYVTGTIAGFCQRYSRSFVWICTDNTSPHAWMHLSRQRSHHLAASIAWPKRLLFSTNAVFCDIVRQRGLRRVTLAFTQNSYQERELKRTWNLDSHRMISGHTKPQHVLPEMTRLKNRCILWVGNLGHNKKPEIFLGLARICLDTDLRFIMIGGGASEHRVSELFNNAPANFEWKGRLPFSETLGFFDQATLFVNTSQKEGFPNTLIQAWLRGVPTLTLGVDPNRVITENCIGYVAADLNDLKAAVIDLLGSPSKYVRMSENARIYAERHHSTRVMAEHFLSVLTSAGILT